MKKSCKHLAWNLPKVYHKKGCGFGPHVFCFFCAGYLGKIVWNEVVSIKGE